MAGNEWTQARGGDKKMKGVSLLEGVGVLFAAGILVLTTASSAPAHHSTGGGTTQKVEVKESEWRFEPSQLIVSPGKVVFQLRNIGTLAHAFAIQGQGFHISSLPTDPGKTFSLEVELETAGDYEVICPLPGHAERGMVGTLTVKAKTARGNYSY